MFGNIKYNDACQFVSIDTLFVIVLLKIFSTTKKI